MPFVTSLAGKQEILASGSQGKTLIARIWRGCTRAAHADEYLRYSYEHGVMPIERKPGNLGVQLFRKIVGDVAEFTVISYWPSMEAMAAMHSDRGDVRRVWPLEKDPDYLLEMPEFVEIAEVHVNDWLLPTA
ncbi:hypothetical protein [Reyranella sp. CPCC 100927]|uniref:hypothetical protein n=1 Tax=Reyranella sp. CPCC 100927 TaxID=2599616 RepID=UPI0011B6C92A|nr:hypothetical protein [Reyranella sp. CPCC 100927]TWS99610.1 hypothetical protein FQU96_34615 [Reyranella sp. CPCC 100927]